MSRLEGKVAFITGTGGGQGRAAAELFARHGARVVGCDLKGEGAQSTLDAVTEQGGEMVSLHPLDLSEADAPQRWIEFGVQALGTVDVLYNNASAVWFTALDAEDSDDAWHYTIRNELDILFATVRAVWPAMIASGGGSIVNTSSGAAIRSLPVAVGRPGSSVAHSAAKAGVLGLTLQVASEGAPYGIRANAILPGLIETPATAPLLADAELRRKCLANNLVPRIGRPSDVALAALYLASDEASYVTGASICVDGGSSAMGPFFNIDAPGGETSYRSIQEPA
jgi:NAD(P)-dependent dehydrogenase (short-subunit alcohol dehydrogenase family)